MYDNRLIGIFDSGVGGLSVLAEIKKLLPNESFIFVADQLHVPYGKKTQKELEAITERIAKFLISKQVKAIVVACNTATVYGIDHLRSIFSLPIIGTVPVVKTVASISKTGKVAVFSTPATAKSAYLKDLIDKFAGDCQIITIGGSGLEELVEEGKTSGGQIDGILKKFLLPLKEQGVDAIALGCTHYPFLRSKIERIVGPNVAVVDSGGAVARQLKKILTHEGMLSSRKDTDLYFTTGDKERFQRVAGMLMNRNIKAEKINL